MKTDNYNFQFLQMTRIKEYINMLMELKRKYFQIKMVSIKFLIHTMNTNKESIEKNMENQI